MLATWWKRIGGDTEKIPNLSSDGQSFEPKPLMTLEEVIAKGELECSTDSSKTVYMDTIVSLVFIRFNERSVYQSCPTCKKKLQEEMGTSDLRCEKCDEIVREPVPTFNLSLSFADMTDTIWLSGFREQAELILGVSARDYVDQTAGKEDEEISEMFSNKLMGKYRITVKAQMNEFADAQGVRFNLVRLS